MKLSTDQIIERHKLVVIQGAPDGKTIAITGRHGVMILKASRDEAVAHYCSQLKLSVHENTPEPNEV